MPVAFEALRSGSFGVRLRSSLPRVSILAANTYHCVGTGEVVSVALFVVSRGASPSGLGIGRATGTTRGDRDRARLAHATLRLGGESWYSSVSSEDDPSPLVTIARGMETRVTVASGRMLVVGSYVQLRPI